MQVVPSWGIREPITNDKPKPAPMTHFADPANAGPDARGHLWHDLSRFLSRWLMPPATQQSGTVGGAALAEVAS